MFGAREIRHHPYRGIAHTYIYYIVICIIYSGALPGTLGLPESNRAEPQAESLFRDHGGELRSVFIECRLELSRI